MHRTLRSIRRTSLHRSDKIESISMSHLTNVHCKRLICVGPFGPSDADQPKSPTHLFKPLAPFIFSLILKPSSPKSTAPLKPSLTASLSPSNLSHCVSLPLTLKPSLSLSPSLFLLLPLLTVAPLPIFIHLRRTTNTRGKKGRLRRKGCAFFKTQPFFIVGLRF